jgi:hypothetical protein
MRQITELQTNTKVRNYQGPNQQDIRAVTAECLGEGTFGKVHSASRSWQDFPPQITSSFLYDDHISNKFPLYIAA